jgi:hypothetical protein
MRTASLVLCGIVLATVAQVESVRLVCSFETPAEVQGIQTTGASVRRVAARAIEGRYALEARFEAVEESRIEIPVRAGDWRGYGSLGLDATNTSDEPVLFSVEVRDLAGAGTVGRTWWELAPGENASFALSLNAPPPMQMGMEGEPPVGDFRILRADHQPVNLARIAAVRILMSKLSRPRTVVFANFRLGPAVSYEKIVDRFGQYTCADWPGKLKREADLKAQLADEQAELKAQPAMPDRDKYGGWAAGPKLEATGYFHSVKRDGKWWLVTPSGHLFFSMGLDSVNATEGATVVEGREQMFEWLPGEGDPLAAQYQAPGGRGPVGAGSKQPPRRAFSFYTANLERKYGKDWYGSWQAMTMARLSAWGFNTVGNWSDRHLYDLKRVPYVGTLSVRGQMAQLSHIPPFPTLRIYDTFDPRFPEAVNRSVRALAGERCNDSWLIGYFVDNELPWGFMRNDRTRYALALEALSLGAASPAKRALVEQLKARYGGIEKLNAAWNAQLASWEELLQEPYRHEGDFTAAAREDMGAFVKELALRYFRTIRETLKKYDPNHMYLGARFAWLVGEDVAWTTQEVEDVAAENCDVISFNVYLPRVDARWDFLKRLDKPAIIGEFNMGALDRGMFYPGVLGASSQTDRARMYQEYVRSVVDHPAFVGCHFFKYSDEPLTGRRDGENFNTGFVTVTDSVYPEMVAAAKKVHAEVYRRRASKRER